MRTRFIIGCSCYGDIARAVTLETNGADYVAFGRFYPSRTKPDAKNVSLDILQKAGQSLSVPICTIGGINRLNAAKLVESEPV